MQDKEWEWRERDRTEIVERQNGWGKEGKKKEKRAKLIGGRDLVKG